MVSDTKFTFWGYPIRGPKIPIFDREYLENGKSQRNVSYGA